MTAATLHDARSRAPLPIWRPLVWLAPLVAAWLGLNYVLPAINTSGVPAMAVRLLIQIALALGLWLGLERTELTPGQRRAVWLAVTIPLTLWLAVVWNAALAGVFRPGRGVPLLPLAIWLPVIVGAPLLLRSRRLGQVLDAMPASWLVGLQVYRVLGGIFLVGWASGTLAGIFALPAGIGDMLTGLMALPAAYYAATGTVEGRRAAVGWNIFGLVDFAVAITLGTLTAPGPLQLIATGVPSIGAGAYPGVLVPAFAVPSSILLHALSLRQLRRRALQD